jgi:N-acetylglucosamine-6-phosphate deacetylase
METFRAFVDLQVNGWAGVDFSDPEATLEELTHACSSILRNGTVGFLATLVTAPEATYARNLPMLASLAEDPAFRGRLLGIHLEGPFISAQDGAVGCHRKECTRAPSVPLLDAVHGWSGGHLRMITIAAELEGAAELARRARELGVAVALGHQMADAVQLRALADAGATCLTHLGNGMPNLVHRHNNVLLAGLANDALTASIICDGAHLPADVIKVILRAKGLDRVVLVSDAAPVAGLEPGRHFCLGREVILEEHEGKRRVRDGARDCLAASAADMLQCVNHLHSLALGLSEADLLQVWWEGPRDPDTDT